MNPDSVKEMQEQNIPVIFGDACQQYILQQAKVERAKLCVIATNDPLASPRIVRQARYLNPTLQIMRGSIQEAHLMVLQGLDEEGLHTRAVVVREGSAASGETLEGLQLRN